MWDARASLGETAGTQDLLAVGLERRAIRKYVEDGQAILDAGCGNGLTACRIARDFEVQVDGFDSSVEMIHAATYNGTRQGDWRGAVHWYIAKAPEIEGFSAAYDLIYSQRLVVNLATWEEQAATIRRLLELLKPGGCYLAVECCQDGLDEINRYRLMLGLPEIEPPTHNRYLQIEQMAQLSREIHNVQLIDVVRYSAGYYLMSRIVNAAIAWKEGWEPDYQSLINHIALVLPATITTMIGQGVMWVWQKQ